MDPGDDRDAWCYSEVLFYHMAWQDFPQFDLYNLTLAHAARDWAVTWDNGTVQGLESGRLTYNLSNPDMRQAWVAGLAKDLP